MTSGCVPSAVIDQMEVIQVAGDGTAYFIPDDLLSLISKITEVGG